MSLVDCLVGTVSSQNQIYMSPSYLFLYPVFIELPCAYMSYIFHLGVVNSFSSAISFY